jgi:beta-lactamase regulating signal transducer with metallopeptidase domain
VTYYSELASFFVRIAVNLILIGTPISVGIFIVLRLTRAAAPRARYLLTLTAFFAAAVLPFVVTVAPIAETPRHATMVESPNTHSATIPGEPPTVDIQARRVEILPQGQPSATSVNLLDSVVHFLSRPSLSIGLFTLWLVGACLLLGREVASHLRVARTRRQWIPASANLRARLSWPKDVPLFVDREFGPCALGVLNSAVVIPARLFDELSLSAAQQIARHELDHLKWRDPFVHAAMRIVRASLWPSAPLWYLARATRLEREAASDRAAVNSISGRLKPDIAALEYASTLISIARRCARVEGRRAAWVATEVGNESGLNDRVRRLMTVSSRLTVTRLSLAFVTLLISASSLVVLPVARFESKRSEHSDPLRGKQQTALTDPTRVGTAPAKDQSNKPAGLSSVNSRSLGEAQDGPKLTSLPTRPDTVVEDRGSAIPIASSAAIDSANTIQPVPDLQLEILKSQMAALGYTNLTSRQLADMRAVAVGPAYVAEMADSGYSGLSADMLIRFKWLGVSSSYIREMKTLGYDNLSPRTMLHFGESGVSSDYIRQMRSRISGSISGEQMAILRFFGASTEFVDKLKQMGYANLNAGQLISMRLQGVSIAFIQGLEAQGRKGLSADELIGIRMRGIN